MLVFTFVLALLCTVCFADALFFSPFLSCVSVFLQVCSFSCLQFTRKYREEIQKSRNIAPDIPAVSLYDWGFLCDIVQFFGIALQKSWIFTNDSFIHLSFLTRSDEPHEAPAPPAGATYPRYPYPGFYRAAAPCRSGTPNPPVS